MKRYSDEYHKDTGHSVVFGYGLVDAGKAVKEAKGIVPV